MVRCGGIMHASIHTTLYRLERASERLAISRPSTLRAHDGEPIDVTIEDLSITGCRISTSLTWNMGDALMIGLPGVGTRLCYIVWSNGGEIGCEFEAPLARADIEATRRAQPLTHVQFPRPISPWIGPQARTRRKSLSSRLSLLIISAAATGAWLLLFAAAKVAQPLLAS